MIDNPAGVYMVDSFKVNVQTVRIDNPSTKNQYRIIVGEFVDPFMGKLKVSSFGQLRFSDSSNRIPSNATLAVESVAYTLSPSFYLGNGSKRVAFNIYPLTETISKDQKYDRLSTIGFDSQNLLMKFNFTFGDSSSFTKVKSGANDPISQAFLANQGASPDKFVSSFNGLAFVPQPDSSTSALLFNVGDGSANFTISVNYSYIDGTTNEKIYGVFNFKIKNESQRFIKVETSSAGYPGDALGEGIGSFETSLTQNKTYINDLLGLRTRISFPGLSDFLRSIKGQYNLMEAAIVLPVSNPSVSFVTGQLQPYVGLIQCDANGKAVKHIDSSYKLIPVETYRTYTVSSSGGLTASALYQSTLDSLHVLNNFNYSPFQDTYKRFYYPFSVYTYLMSEGKKPNNPFLISLYSDPDVRGADQVRTPTGVSFYDPSNSGVDKIKLLIYLNKIN